MATDENKPEAPPPVSSTAAMVTDEGVPPSSMASSTTTPADYEGLAALGDRDAIFEALWKRCLEAWDDDKPHAAILEHSLKTEKLPDLAGNYRAIKDSDPDKAVRAQKKIDGLVLAATQMLMSMKTPTRTKTPWQWTAAAAIFFAVVCAFLFYQLFVPHSR